jgi:hypothetical protein
MAVVYENRTYRLKVVRLKCLNCESIIQSDSKGHHDIVSCGCCRISIDGGISKGSTINGNPFEMQDLSVYKTDDDHVLPLQIVTERHEKIKTMMIR